MKPTLEITAENMAALAKKTIEERNASSQHTEKVKKASVLERILSDIYYNANVFGERSLNLYVKSLYYTYYLKEYSYDEETLVELRKHGFTIKPVEEKSPELARFLGFSYYKKTTFHRVEW